VPSITLHDSCRWPARQSRRPRSGALASFGVKLHLIVVVSLDQLDTIKDVIEFQADNHEVGVVNDLVAQRRLCRGERSDGENTLIVFPQERCECFRTAHDGGDHLSGRNGHEESVDGLASDLGDIALCQRASIPENMKHQSIYSFSS
jgi:hypothetical protein